MKGKLIIHESGVTSSVDDTTTPPQSMLTTVDNPFDPFTQFDEWYAFDRQKGYYSCELLDRIAKTSDTLSDADQDVAIENAINEIVRLNVSGMHRKAVASI